jgi:tetratricopeptide (TPR) repeat protein
MTAPRSLLWSLSAGLCASLTLGCGTAPTKAQREQRALEQEASADELFKKGQAAGTIGDLTRAEQYFVAARKAGGDERKIIQRLLVVCIADQRYPVALEYAEQYLHRHPGDVDVQFAAASIYAALGDTTRARRLLERVVRSRPDWSEAHYALATVLREEGAAPGLADVHDLEYLRLTPKGPLAERARARLSKAAP